MTEQQATDRLEQLVGSVDKCFRLMRLYTTCQQSLSGDRFSLRAPRSLDEVFTATAKREGYSQAAISHYLNHIR